MISVRQLGDPSVQLVRVDPDQSMTEALATLRDDPSVLVAERDSYSAPNAVPNDPLFDQLWGLQNTGLGIAGFSGALAGADIDALEAWTRTAGTPSIVIADLDSGYRFDSPDLDPVAWTNPLDPPAEVTTMATASSMTREELTSSVPRRTAPRSTETQPTTT